MHAPPADLTRFRASTCSLVKGPRLPPLLLGGNFQFADIMGRDIEGAMDRLVAEGVIGGGKDSATPTRGDMLTCGMLPEFFMLWQEPDRERSIGLMV